MPSDTFLYVTIHGASFVHIFRCVSSIVRETRLYRYKCLSTKELLLYLQIAAFYAEISLLTKMFKEHIARGLCEAENFIVVIIMMSFPVQSLHLFEHPLFYLQYLCPIAFIIVVGVSFIMF